MFDFEKLEVYQLAKETNTLVFKFINKQREIDDFVSNQWKRASLSSMLNLAEGVGRISKADKKHFLTIARGSVFECVAVLQSQKDLGLIDDETYSEMYDKYEQVSKMLLGLFRSY